VVLNDDELDWGGPGTEGKATDMTVIVVRRKGLGVYRVGARMLPVKVSFLVPAGTDTRNYPYHLVLQLRPCLVPLFVLLYHRPIHTVSSTLVICL